MRRKIKGIRSHDTHHTTVDVSADAAVTEAADADVEAARVVDTPADAETADVEAAGVVDTPADAETADVEAADAGEEKPMKKR